MIALPCGCRMKVAAALIFLVTLTTARAQEGSSGNTTIFNGAQMTFFSDHSFVTGGGGTQPGIINTIRTAPFGILNYGPDANTVTGADDANYVDGYVRKLGSTPFIFPVGDNSHYGPFRAVGDGTTGAYFFADPTSAVTSILPSGNYPVLPMGGPFPSATYEDKLEAVSTIEYWDIDGINPTTLTLTWDASSAISALTTGQLNKLTIAGWNGSQWVAINSVVDVTSILGGASELNSGSITTTAPAAPELFTAYTFASRDTPLPVTLTNFTITKEGQTSHLSWSTTAETNSDRFEIERSQRGKDWNKIGTVASHGESKELKDYEFTDEAPMNGENLYRLKMVDLDETFAYSRIRSISFDPGMEISAYPNPVSDRLLFSKPDMVKNVTLWSSAGQQMLRSDRVNTRGIDVSKLPVGVYSVKVTSANGTTTTRSISIVR